MSSQMYGDTEAIRRRSGQLREQAADLRLLADQLSARTDALAWRGRAAEAMRLRVSERSAHLRAAASEHEAAADAVDQHAQSVLETQDAIAAAQRRATTLIADAATRVARARDAGQDPDPDDVTLTTFASPPSGHRDWLAVELPGL